MNGWTQRVKLFLEVFATCSVQSWIYKKHFFNTYYEMWHQTSLSVLDILHLLTFLKICLMMNVIYHLANRIVHFFLFFITFCLKVRLKSDQFGQIIPESYTNNKWKQRVLSLPILLDRPGERSNYISICIKIWQLILKDFINLVVFNTSKLH